MPNTTPLQLDDQGVLGLLRDFEALRIWEVLRSARTAVTVAELAQATGLEQRVLQGHVVRPPLATPKPIRHDTD